MPTFRQATVPVLLCLSAPSTLALADPGCDLSGPHAMKGQGNMPADPLYSGRCECLLFRRYPALVTPNLENRLSSQCTRTPFHFNVKVSLVTVAPAASNHGKKPSKHGHEETHMRRTNLLLFASIMTFLPLVASAQTSVNSRCDQLAAFYDRYAGSADIGRAPPGRFERERGYQDCRTSKADAVISPFYKAI